MKHELSNARRELAVFSLAQIDAICEEFESEWSPVGSSEFNRYLGQVSDVALPTLFRNLLQIEMRRRKTAGQEPKQEEYLSRYPQHSDLIKEEFEIHKSTIAVSMVEDTAIGDQPTRRKHRLPKVSRLGDYLLGRELGRGAMGIVFAARHVRRGNEVALKTLPTVGGDELQRFKQEFRSLTNINHPNLVGLHTLQVDGGQWFFTMDVVQGEEFLACVRPQGKLDLTRLRDAFSQLVIGVNALHSKNILHRDLKPSNVMVSHEGQVRLLDFGLIVDLSAFGSSTESQIAGTPTYMAPEQFLGQTTAASDWYAVGVMLYQALTGNLPFRGPVNELFRDKQNNDPPPLPADVPEDFRNLCRKLLSRHPQDRPDVTTIFRIACPDTGESAAVLIDNGPADQLLGRDKHVAQIQETIRSFDEHQGPQTLFISGKSGEGKTVLAEYFLKRFREAPTLIVLSGRCYDRESVPFKAIDTLIDALCVRLLEMSDEQVRQLLTPDVAILTELFPVLTRVRAIAQLEKVNIEHVELDRVRRLAGNALRELLSRFGRNLTLVCFVDDLQWGDADSAELLLNVLRPPAGPNILLIGTYRSDEAESSRFLQAWKSATEQLEQQIPHTECEVSPLTPAECVQLVVETVGVDNETVRAHAAAIAEEAAGNPLILSELASYYDPEDRSSQPLHIEDILERKLGLLPPEARALLEIVSVSGQALSLYEASHSVGHSTVPFSTITRMRSERLVRLVGDEHEPTVDTYHDRIRELVLRDMDAADRQGLHVKLAEVIEASVENVSNPDQSNDQAHPRVYDLAYHFYEGGHSKAFGYQQEAGEAAMRAYALENAIDHFNKAEQIKPDDADQNSQYRLYERLGEAYGKSQRLEEAMRSYRKAVPHASIALERAVAFDGIGDKYQRQGDYGTALEFYYKALTELDNNCPREWLTVLFDTTRCLSLVHLPWLIRRSTKEELQERMQLASYLFHRVAHAMLVKGDLLRYTHGSARQMYSALRSGRLDAIAVGYSKISFNYAAFSLPSLSKWFLGGAMRIAQHSRDSLTHALVEAHAGLAYYNLGRLRKSKESLESALKTMERQGDSWLRMTCHHHLRHLYAVLGDSEQEIAEAQIELRIGEATADPMTISWAHYGFANAKARIGMLDQAHGHMQRALVALENLDAHQLTRAVLLHHHGFVLLQSSDYSSATEVLNESSKLIVHHWLYMDYMLRTYPLLVESLLGPNWREADTNANIRRAKRLSRRTRFFGWRFPNLRSHAQRVQGRLLCATGRRRKATRYFEKSIESARQLGAEYDEARALLDLAAVDDERRDELRADAVTILVRLQAVIPRAEMWQLGENPDESCVAPEFEYPA